MSITDRYATAIRSSNLKSEERTQCSDSDVVGAMGLASKRHPLAAALTRLFLGDNGAALACVATLADMLGGRKISRDLGRVQAEDIARAVLAWHRDGVCTDCGGHGYERVPGTPALSTNPCKTCGGVGRIPFDQQFRARDREHARWLLAEIQSTQAQAGAEAMRKLAPRLEL